MRTHSIIKKAHSNIYALRLFVKSNRPRVHVRPIGEPIFDRMNAMTQTTSAGDTQYDPNHLLDSLREKLHLRNDAGLSRALEVEAPVISKIRHRRLPVGASMLIRMHEVSGLTIRELRVLMGDRRDKFRMSAVQFKPKDSNASR